MKQLLLQIANNYAEQSVAWAASRVFELARNECPPRELKVPGAPLRGQFLSGFLFKERK